MKEIKNVVLELFALIFLFLFYITSDVYATITGNTGDVRVYLMVNHSLTNAQNINKYFIATFILLGISTLFDIVALFIKKNKE